MTNIPELKDDSPLFAVGTAVFVSDLFDEYTHVEIRKSANGNIVVTAWLPNGKRDVLFMDEPANRNLTTRKADRVGSPREGKSR